MCHAQCRVYILRFSFPLKELLSKVAENYHENINDTATFQLSLKMTITHGYSFLIFLQTFYYWSNKIFKVDFRCFVRILKKPLEKCFIFSMLHKLKQHVRYS